MEKILEHVTQVEMVLLIGVVEGEGRVLVALIRLLEKVEMVVLV